MNKQLVQEVAKKVAEKILNEQTTPVPRPRPDPPASSESPREFRRVTTADAQNAAAARAGTLRGVSSYISSVGPGRATRDNLEYATAASRGAATGQNVQTVGGQRYGGRQYDVSKWAKPVGEPAYVKAARDAAQQRRDAAQQKRIADANSKQDGSSRGPASSDTSASSDAQRNSREQMRVRARQGLEPGIRRRYNNYTQRMRNNVAAKIGNAKTLGVFPNALSSDTPDFSPAEAGAKTVDVNPMTAQQRRMQMNMTRQGYTFRNNQNRFRGPNRFIPVDHRDRRRFGFITK